MQIGVELVCLLLKLQFTIKGGYMGSSYYDPQLAENEIKKEHIGSLKIQLSDLEKTYEHAVRREDQNQINKLKPQIEDLNKRLNIVT
jgi:hypothetical protein